jgi:predicted nucleotidyltransferase
MNPENVIEVLRNNRHALAHFHVRSMPVFGSVARGEAGPDSDIDILVKFKPDAHIGLFAFAKLQRYLQEILGRDVDLATP